MTDSAMKAGDLVNEKVGKAFDDLKGLTDPKNWTLGKIIGMIGTILVATIFIVLTFYLGSYGFKNPDPDSCWVIKGVDSAALTKEGIIAKAKAASVDVPEGYPLEMHKVYTAWALWGFWTNVGMVSMFILTSILAFIKPTISVITATVGGLGWLVSTVLWLVFGAIWRYSYGGSVAAGDRLVREDGVSDEDWKATLEASSAASGYQIKNGKFLAIVFGIVTAVIMLILIAFAVAGCLMCVCGMDKDSINSMASGNIQLSSDKQDDDKQPLAADDFKEQEQQLGVNDDNQRETKL